jgi:hypothetical protein
MKRQLLCLIAALVNSCAHGPRRVVTEPKPEIVTTLLPRFALLRVGEGTSYARLVVRLKGSDEALAWAYCGLREWDWGDGCTTSILSDCPPYEDGNAHPASLFVAQHAFRGAGIFRIRFWLAGRQLADETLRVSAP